MQDIRKRAISRQLVRRGDGYDGPVIVKSDLNCAGVGERLHLKNLAAQRARVRGLQLPMSSQLQYQVFPRADLVPAGVFEHPYLVVERFLPEREGELYFCRSYHFFGTRSTTVRLGSAKPIVLGRTAQSIEDVEPHPEVIRVAQELGLEYGKIDYTVSEGNAVILDINKTTGGGGVSDDPRVVALRRQRAMGIFEFLPS